MPVDGLPDWATLIKQQLQLGKPFTLEFPLEADQSVLLTFVASATFGNEQLLVALVEEGQNLPPQFTEMAARHKAAETRLYIGISPDSSRIVELSDAQIAALRERGEINS